MFWENFVSLEGESRKNVAKNVEGTSMFPRICCEDARSIVLMAVETCSKAVLAAMLWAWEKSMLFTMRFSESVWCRSPSVSFRYPLM